MARVKNKASALQHYINVLSDESDRMEDNLKELRTFFCNLDWHDGVREKTKEILNDHISQMNKVFARLDDIIDAASRLKAEAEEYSEL